MGEILQDGSGFERGPSLEERREKGERQRFLEARGITARSLEEEKHQAKADFQEYWEGDDERAFREWLEKTDRNRTYYFNVTPPIGRDGYPERSMSTESWERERARIRIAWERERFWETHSELAGHKTTVLERLSRENQTSGSIRELTSDERGRLGELEKEIEESTDEDAVVEKMDEMKEIIERIDIRKNERVEKGRAMVAEIESVLARGGSLYGDGAKMWKRIKPAVDEGRVSGTAIYELKEILDDFLSRPLE